ncbi:MAG: hypothetical protein WCO58_02785 [bacterium]
MKQYILNIKKVLFTAIIVLVVSAKGYTKNSNDTTWHHLPYSKNPTTQKTGAEIAEGIENGTLELNMSIDEFVIQKTNIINIYCKRDKWKDAQGNLVAPYKASRQFIASMYRNAKLQTASWQSDQALVFRLTTGSIGSGKKEKVVIKYFDYWNRNPYQNEGMFTISPSALSDVVGNYPDINLGSNQCLNDIFIKQIQQQPIAQTPAPCTTCNQQVQQQVYQQPQQQPCNNCQQVQCQGGCNTWSGIPVRVPAIYTDQYTSPWWNFNGYPPNVNCNYGYGNMGYAQQGCGYCGVVGCNGGCYGRGRNPYPYMIAGQLISAGTMLGLAYFSQPQQTILVQNYNTTTSNGGTSQTWTPTNNGSGIVVTPGGSTSALNWGTGNSNSGGTNQTNTGLNWGTGNSFGGGTNQTNTNFNTGTGNSFNGGGSSNWGGTSYVIPAQWLR